jgi:hypothetical protein
VNIEHFNLFFVYRIVFGDAIGDDFFFGSISKGKECPIEVVFVDAHEVMDPVDPLQYSFII